MYEQLQKTEEEEEEEAEEEEGGGDDGADLHSVWPGYLVAFSRWKWHDKFKQPHVRFVLHYVCQIRARPHHRLKHVTCAVARAEQSGAKSYSPNPVSSHFLSVPEPRNPSIEVFYDKTATLTNTPWLFLALWVYLVVCYHGSEEEALNSAIRPADPSEDSPRLGPRKTRILIRKKKPKQKK